MRRFFSPDSPVLRFLTVLMEMAEINLLFLLCAVPVLTAGAAYCAMLDSLYTLENKGEGCFSVPGFFRVFRQSLKKSMSVWIPGAAGGALLIYGLLYWLQTASGVAGIVFCGVYAAVLLLLFGTVQISLFIMTRAQEWRYEQLKDAFLLSLAGYPLVVCSFLATVSWLLLLFLPGARLISLLPLILLFCVSSPAYVCIRLLTRIMKPVMPELFRDDPEEDDED